MIVWFELMCLLLLIGYWFVVELLTFSLWMFRSLVLICKFALTVYLIMLCIVLLASSFVFALADFVSGLAGQVTLFCLC